jgi:predicted nucleic acid-binding protein
VLSPILCYPTALSFLRRLIEQNGLDPTFRLQEERAAVKVLMRRYEAIPMSLADACLVRMSEHHAGCLVFTCDTDFQIYRRHRRQAIPLIAPF